MGEERRSPYKSTKLGCEKPTTQAQQGEETCKENTANAVVPVNYLAKMFLEAATAVWLFDPDPDPVASFSLLMFFLRK